jgi:protein gp37
MNRQGPDSIAWTNWTFNPVTGCLHGCPWCYARKFANRGMGPYKDTKFKPTFYRKRLDEISEPKPGERVFVVSMGDLLGDWVPREWIEPIINRCWTRPDVQFQFLTKNPSRYSEFNWPKNCWLGTSVARIEDKIRVHDLIERAPHDRIRWISAAPLINIEPWDITTSMLNELDWIVLEPYHGQDKDLADRTARSVRYWLEQRPSNFDEIPLFVKGMPDPADNTPQMYPEIKTGQTGLSAVP